MIANSVPSEAICCEIDPALWNVGSPDFVKMCKNDAFFQLIEPIFSIENNILVQDFLPYFACFVTFCKIGPSSKTLKGTLTASEIKMCDNINNPSRQKYAKGAK